MIAKKTLCALVLVIAGSAGCSRKADSVSQAEAKDKDKPGALQARAIAEEAYIYAFPMIAAYKALYQFNVDKTIVAVQGAASTRSANEAHVFTPKDTAIVTPNSDTPYSMVQLDLRAEPIVLCVPAVEKAPVLLGAAHRHVLLQLRLHRQPRHRQRRGLLHGGRSGLEGRDARRRREGLRDARRSSASSSTAPSSSARPTSTT